MSEGPRILVVDDSEANRLLASTVLERDGYRISVAGSATEVLERLAEQIPDLILMDVRLPGQDGLSLTRQLKADPATSSIPVVALTANVVGGYLEECLEAGCSGYISKPIDIKTFGELVGEFLTASPSSRT